MKMLPTILHKINISFGIFILFFWGLTSSYVNAQNYFSKSNFHYLDQYSVTGGLLVNQANHQNFGYKPNNKAVISANVTAVRLKNFSLHIGLGFRKKSLIGYGIYPWLKVINNLEPTEIMSFQRAYKIDFLYFNADALFKVTFLQKYKLQPFLFVGARYNKILSYSDSLDIYNKTLLSDSFKKRDNYINSFFGIGCNYSINSNLSIHFIFEENNDMIPYKQIYFNSNPEAKRKEIRFLSYSFQIGIQYTLPKVEYKLNKTTENKVE